MIFLGEAYNITVHFSLAFVGTFENPEPLENPEQPVIFSDIIPTDSKQYSSSLFLKGVTHMQNPMTFLIIFLGVMTAMAPLSTDMYLPSLPEISSSFGISTSMTQLTLTMTMIGMSVGQILGGPVSDRLGRKIPLLWGWLDSLRLLWCVR